MIVLIAATGGGVAVWIGRSPGFGGMVAIAAAGLWVVWRLLFTRMAHSAFRGGRTARARLLYRLVGWMSFQSAARGATRVSRAACFVVDREYTHALSVLDEIDSEVVDVSTWAACLNNRAYSLVRLGREGELALEAVDEAISLRPTHAGFHHTRGIALALLGRSQRAIREFEEVWRRSEGKSDLLESERCFDVARAWRELGEHEYARDYFERARQASSESVWAELAATELDRLSSERSASP